MDKGVRLAVVAVSLILVLSMSLVSAGDPDLEDPDLLEGYCGDGLVVLYLDEDCDDGNKVSGDGCSSSCSIETGWTCDDSQPSVCTPICGDGLVLGGEECDDGNTVEGDGCSSLCTLICTETDEGLNYSINGKTCLGDDCFTDICAGGEVVNLFEYFCNERNEIEEKGYLCPNGCSDGACLGDDCILSELESKTCSYKGIDYIIKRETGCNFEINYSGKTAEFEIGMTTLKFHVFDLGNGVQIKNNNGCSDSLAVMFFSESILCSESDGGKNYSVKGNCADSSGGGPWEDICYRKGDITGENDDSIVLREHWCGLDNYCQESNSIVCPNGCVDGACLPGAETNVTNINVRTETTCTKSDGGIDYYLPGIMIDEMGNTNVDRCDGEGGITEYSCSEEGKGLGNTYMCPNGCEEGACVYNEEISCLSSCEVDGKCYPIGYRKGNGYCTENLEIVRQVGGGEDCVNSFECKSNICIDNACVNQGIFKKFLEWFAALFGGDKDNKKPDDPGSKPLGTEIDYQFNWDGKELKARSGENGEYGEWGTADCDTVKKFYLYVQQALGKIDNNGQPLAMRMRAKAVWQQRNAQVEAWANADGGPCDKF